MPSPEIPLSLRILKKACQKNGYKWELADNYSNNLVKISNKQKCFFASNSKIGAYPLNSNSAQLVNDKAWTYKILQQNNYNIPQGDYFFLKKEYRELRGDHKERKDALKYANKLGYPIFIKPNNSSLGLLAEIIYSEQELTKHLEKISEIDHIALIQEYLQYPEYRIFVVDGEVKFTYKRNSPFIIGNGKNTIKELIEQVNLQIKREKNKVILSSPFIQKQFEKLKLSWKHILKKGQKFQIMSKTNISAGGKLTNYTEKISEQTKNWVHKLTNFLQLRICGIDVFVKDSINNPESFIIIEINQNPNLSGIYEAGYQKKALEIWKEVLDKYFKEPLINS